MFIELCNTLALYGILSSLCLSPAAPPPEEGTILDEYCEGTTNVIITADGQGGELVTEQPESEACGYVPPPPPAGTLLKSGCSEDYLGVKWFQYADGEGGTYVEKDPKSWQCGYRRYLNLSMEKEYGDRFDPAIVKVDYKDMLGREEGWGMKHHSTTIGYAEREGCCTVKIYGDGRIGDGIFTLGNQEIQFRIEDEPRCALTENSSWPNGPKTDCEGLRQKPNQEHIFYGDDDERVVTWELGVLIYASHRKYGDDVPLKILEEWDDTHPEWEKWEKRVEKYNEVYRKSGVHVEYVLTKLYLAHWHKVPTLANLVVGLPVDVTLGYGTTYPDTCGVADVTTYFVEGQPPSSMSNCDIHTDLHEIGHSVGLAHGPENQAWQASGYIFPDFGHGWNDICDIYDDLMSYGRSGLFHSNGKMYCDEILGYKWLQGIVAGGLEYSDTAKSLNRVRYNVSLIHKENDYVDEDSPLQMMRSESRRINIEVVD